MHGPTQNTTMGLDSTQRGGEGEEADHAGRPGPHLPCRGPLPSASAPCDQTAVPISHIPVVTVMLLRKVPTNA